MQRTYKTPLQMAGPQAGRPVGVLTCTYRTTEPRMKQLRTDICGTEGKPRGQGSRSS